MKFLPIVIAVLFIASCAGCPFSSSDEPTQISSTAFKFQETKSETDKNEIKQEKTVKVINIGPRSENGSETSSSGGSANQPLPTEVALDNALTDRLKQRMEEAFKNRGGTPPNVEIYLSSMSLDQFAKYYEDKGYKIQRTSLSAMQIISPLLEEKPELKDTISLNNYYGVNINQVIVEGLNISAADKYIDPTTYEIKYKTFVTVTK